MTLPLRIAVIPAAGLGTRLLPLTRCVPKELLPVAGRALIEHTLGEAFASGVERAVVISSAAKPALEEHLAARAGEWGEVVIVRQSAPRGLGDAIACAREAVGGEPFAVLLPDTLFDTLSGTVFDRSRPALAQLLAAWHEPSACLLATQEVAADRVPSCGIVTLARFSAGTNLHRVTALVEKPAPGLVRSREAILGRYILPYEIFYSLERTLPDARGEVQLTAAIALYLAGKNTTTGTAKSKPTTKKHERQQAPGGVYAVRIQGKCYDAGDLFGYLLANAAWGLREPGFAEEFRAALEALLKQTGAHTPRRVAGA
jgi:UTP--glucose-1-phosphate uridylyltransferase